MELPQSPATPDGNPDDFAMHASSVSVIPTGVRSPIRLTWTLLALAAATAVPSTGDVLRLWPHRAPRAATTAPALVPTLTCFPPEPGTANGTAVVICPGGGYLHLSTVREGSDVAKWLAGHGVYAAVLAYRVNAAQPAPMLDGQRAVRTLRYHAKAWGIDRHRIGIMGFSAGDEGCRERV